MAPLVSIVLPLLNAGTYIAPRICSILEQTMSDWELIVCDSYSEDGTWEYLQQFKMHSRIRLYQVPRKGIYAGWNECLRRVSGKYISIATGDDTACPQFLERMVGVLESRTDVNLAMCQFDFIDEKGVVIPDPAGQRPNDCFGEWQERAHRRSGQADFLAHLVRGGSWTTITSVLFTRELLDKVGFFLEGVTPVVDQLWAAKAALLTDSIWIPERLATWRIHGAQGSSRWSRRSGWQQVQLTAAMIRDSESLIPSSWKQDPEWHDKLMWGAWHYYRSCYGLNRTNLRQKPLTFLTDMAWALGHEPAYVVKRLAEKLTWNSPEYGDSTDYFRRLIEEWKVPWPPQAI